MKDIIDIFTFNKPFSTFWWIIPIIMILLPILVVAMADLNIELVPGTRKMSAISLGIGGAVILYRFFVMAFNDIKGAPNGD